MNDFRAFADSNDIEKVTAFLENGLYISNTMLVMELDLDKFLLPEGPECPHNTAIEKEDISKHRDYEISAYDTWELDEYLACHAACFEELSYPEQIEEQLQNVNSGIYVLRINKELISSVMVWDADANTAATENIFTMPEFQGKGYCRILLTKVLTDLVKAGKRKARLTVYGDDSIAISLYMKLGYRITKILQEFSYE